MNKRKLLVWIPIIALLLNVVGYVIFTRTRTPSNPIPAASRTGASPPPTVPGGGVAPGSRQLDQIPAKNEEAEKKAIAIARRAAGLAALEAGNYDSALINFTEARALLGDKANVGELLRVTNDLRKSGKAVGKLREPPPVREPVAPRPRARATSERRLAVRDEPAATDSNQVQAPPASGLLIVTTTPRGLLVQVDDVGVDLTPMRTKVRPGSHRVTLLDGDRKVYETTVDVREGATATLLKDFPPEPAPEAPRAVAPVAATTSADPVAARNDGPRTTTTPAPTSTIRTPTPSPASGPSAGTGTGTLDISSPGLYGVVWVNGRPRGYPPLVIRDLPVGKTKVEVRVNGIQKRSATIVVKPGLTTDVQLRSQETVL